MLVVRELMLGPRRFSELRAGLPGISANVLTQRLEGLEESGILVRRRLPPPASVQVYELTPWGYEAEPLLQVIGRWAARSPTHDPTLAFSAVSLMLSMRTMLDPARAGGLVARVGFRIGEEGFVARLGEGQLPIERGDPAGCDVIFVGQPPLIAAAIYGGVPLAALEQAGQIAVEGDRQLAERYVTLFPMPAKVGALV